MSQSDRHGRINKRQSEECEHEFGIEIISFIKLSKSPRPSKSPRLTVVNLKPWVRRHFIYNHTTALPLSLCHEWPPGLRLSRGCSLSRDPYVVRPSRSPRPVVYRMSVFSLSGLALSVALSLCQTLRWPIRDMRYSLAFQTFSMNFTWIHVSFLRFQHAHMLAFHIIHSETTE